MHLGFQFVYNGSFLHANIMAKPAVLDFCFGFIFAYVASTTQVMVVFVGKDGNGGRLSDGNGIGELSKFPSWSSLSCKIVVLLYHRPHIFVHQR